MRNSVKHIYRGYARALTHRGESYERLATRAAIAEGVRKTFLAENMPDLAWDMEGEVSGYYDLMRGISQ